MKTFKNFILSSLCVAMLAFSIVYSITSAYALGDSGVITDNAPANNAASGTSLAEVEERVEGVLGDFEAALVNLSLSIFPIALIILLLTLLFTHDTKKIAFVIKILLVILAATGGILLTHAGFVLNFLKNLIGVTG